MTFGCNTTHSAADEARQGHCPITIWRTSNRNRNTSVHNLQNCSGSLSRSHTCPAVDSRQHNSRPSSFQFPRPAIYHHSDNTHTFEGPCYCHCRHSYEAKRSHPRLHRGHTSGARSHRGRASRMERRAIPKRRWHLPAICNDQKERLCYS